MRTGWLVASVVGALGALGGMARADRTIGVVVTGEPTLQPQLAAQLETWLRGRGFVLVPSPLPPDTINTVIDCFAIEDEGCAKAAVVQHAITPAVLYARVELVEGTGDGRTVSITTYWFEKAGKVAKETRTCERCTDASLRTTADAAIAALSGIPTASGHVKITTQPSGATVIVDGTAAGVTPLDLDLTAGTHHVELASPMGGAAARDLTITSGTSQPLDVVMTPSDRPAPLRRSHTLSLGLVGVGAAALVTGVILLAVDEDADGVPRTQRTFRNTGPTGAGLVIGGAIVAGAGAFFAYTGRF